MQTFTLEIVTPDDSVPERSVALADVPASDGRLTVLPGHAPLVCALSAGETRVRLEAGTEETWRTGPGTLTVSGARTTLLVKSATLRH